MKNVKVLVICIMMLLIKHITPELWATPTGKQRDYWRRVSTTEHWGSSSQGGEAGQSIDSYSIYYYNTLIPTRVDSTLVNVDVDNKSRSYYLYTYSYMDFPEYYEVLRKTFDGVSSAYPCLAKRVFRYTYDDLLILNAELTAGGDLVTRYTEYVYNDSGLLLNRNTYIDNDIYQPDVLIEHETCTYNDNNQMLSRALEVRDYQIGEMVVKRTENMYYSIYSAPDSLCTWERTSASQTVTERQHNSFDQNGNVVFKTNWKITNSANPYEELSETSVTYQLSPNGYVPTSEWTYIRNGQTMALQDSIEAHYTYSDDYLHINYESYQFRAQESVERDSLYNQAGLMVSSSFSRNDFWSGYSESISHVWSYCSETEDVIQTPALAPEISVAPNPFTGFTTIKVKLAEDDSATARIYNLKGQLVRSYSDRRLQKGDNYLKWDGRDDRQQQLASGIYVVRISTPYGSSSRKIVLVK